MRNRITSNRKKKTKPQLIEIEGLETGFFNSSDEIIFLIGAGASVDAGISTVSQLTHQFETSLKKDSQSAKLYYFFKNRSLYSNIVNEKSSTNIEIILALINDHLYITPQNPLYHLIGNWDKELLSITAGQTKPIEELRDQMETFLVTQLSTDNGNLSYLHPIFALQEHLKGTLKIFSLNHDLIVEKSYGKYYNDYKSADKNAYILESGFSDASFPIQEGIAFDTKNFKASKTDKQIHLYKLHGSINWLRAPNGEIVSGKPEEPGLNPRPLVFGTNQKYKSSFPYSELYVQFKEVLTKAKMLIVIGYSFQDQHINDAIKNALYDNSRTELKLIVNNTSFSETEFFSFPRLNKKTSKDFLLPKIFKHIDYEHYMNFALMMHPVYYSRNYDEDALFLAKLYLNKSLLHLINIPSDKEEIYYTLISEIQSDHKIEQLLQVLNGYYSDSTTDVSAIYNALLQFELCSENFTSVKKLIADTKIALYFLHNKIAQVNGEDKVLYTDSFLEYPKQTTALIFDWKTLFKKYKTDLTFLYGIAAEIIDEVRLIEKYILRFIPTHLSIMIAMIEQCREATESEKENFLIRIYEWFLKYNYLIDMLIVKPVDLYESVDSMEYNILSAELGERYIEGFHDIIDALKIRKNIALINTFLKEIRNAFLFRNIKKSDFRELGIGLQDFKFEKTFLSLRKDYVNDHTLPNIVRSVLHEKTTEELRMQTRVRIYSKAVAKSMSSRLNYLDRLTTDIVTMAKQMSNKEEIFNSIRVRIREMENGYTTTGEREEDFMFYASSKLDVLDEMFFTEQHNDKRQIETHIFNNMNWFSRRYSKIMKEFLANLSVIHFHDRHSRYINNLEVYEKLFGAAVDFTDYVRQYTNVENLQQKNILLAKALNCILPKHLERIVFKHFRAKDFLNKELRSWHLYKFYNSHFYVHEHVFLFGNIDRFLKNKLPA